MTKLSYTDKLIAGIYKHSRSWFMDAYGLAPVQPGSVLSEFEHVRANIAFATNAGFDCTRTPTGLVVGGACIGYSEAEPKRLSLDIIADLISPLAFAKWSGNACLIYVNVAEEAMVTAERIALETWTQLGDGIEQLVVSMAGRIGVSDLHILRTDRADVDEAIRHAVARRAALLPDSKIGNLYSIGYSGRTSYHDPVRLAQYRRNIVSYLPCVIRQATSLPIRRLVAAENVHQVKAINMARELLSEARESIAGSVPPDGDQIDHVVFVSPPSITGTRRMATARHKSGIYPLEPASQFESKMMRMTPSAAYYWDRIWPEALRCVWSRTGTTPLVAALDEIGTAMRSAFRLPGCS